jgi:hypothetical protein
MKRGRFCFFCPRENILIEFKKNRTVTFFANVRFDPSKKFVYSLDDEPPPFRSSPDF